MLVKAVATGSACLPQPFACLPQGVTARTRLFAAASRSCATRQSPLCTLLSRKFLPSATRLFNARRASTSTTDSHPTPTTASLIEEVEWNAYSKNKVECTGITGKDVELRQFDSGNVKGSTVVAVRGKDSVNTDWFPLEMWGPLAVEAERVVKKGTRVAVEGRLGMDKWEDKTGAKRERLKIVVSALHKIRSDFPQDQPFTADRRQAPGGNPYQQGAGPVKMTRFQLWKSFLEDPEQWWDVRDSKTKDTQPDFKHKEDGDRALWLDGAPQWAVDAVKEMDGEGTDVSATEELDYKPQDYRSPRQPSGR